MDVFVEHFCVLGGGRKHCFLGGVRVLFVCVALVVVHLSFFHLPTWVNNICITSYMIGASVVVPHHAHTSVLWAKSFFLLLVVLVLVVVWALGGLVVVRTLFVVFLGVCGCRCLRFFLAAYVCAQD
jgi:hypothetical protein